ncbi:MAG: polysulfide reductase NrfD, partial [Planctomycetaceae bacterium]|nr:polysulfide reductase NrfD [Planctomycetaceae bacterium]
ILAVVGIPAACVLHGYVGFLFGALKANPWWSTALMPIIFLASAIVSGIAALILLYLFLSRRRGVPADKACLREMCRALWIALIVAFSLEVLELVHMAYERHAEWHVISTLLRERLAFSYGVVQVLIGSVIPFFLLAVCLKKNLNFGLLKLSAGLASFLVLVQVFAMRWNVVVGGQLFSRSMRGFVEFPLPIGGREGVIAAVIVLLLPLFVLTVALKLLPVWGEADEHDEAVPTAPAPAAPAPTV